MDQRLLKDTDIIKKKIEEEMERQFPTEASSGRKRPTPSPPGS